MIVALDDLTAQRESWRKAGRTVVFTNGCFDVLHVGHVRSLRQARELGDVLVVGLNDDASVRSLKGPDRPVFPVEERAEMLSALEAVDAVVVFSDLVPTAVVAALQPDIYCKGDDYRSAPLPEADIVRAYGGRIEFLTFVPNRSSSQVLERVDAPGDDAGVA